MVGNCRRMGPEKLRVTHTGLGLPGDPLESNHFVILIDTTTAVFQHAQLAMVQSKIIVRTRSWPL